MKHIKLYTLCNGLGYVLLFHDDHIHYEPTFDSLIEHLRKLVMVVKQ